MSKKSAAMIRALCNHFHGGSAEAILSRLSPDEKDEVAGFQLLGADVAAPFQPAKERISSLHYSWLLPAMQKLPKEIASLVLAALPESHATKLSEALDLSPIKTSFTPQVEAFILDTFYPYFIEHAEALPISFVPETPLTPLASFSKAQLMQLMSFLGLYDLAGELRHIVDKKRLNRFYDCLTPKEKQYLGRCLHKRDKLSTASLKLKGWEGDRDPLRRQIHLRGLSRLGHSLCGQPQDLTWQIAHRLDSGRGALLEKCARQPLDPDVIRILINQVRKLIQYLNYKMEG